MSDSRTYLAISIGPIYKTIQRARKTRELWAASFLLSQYMRCILKHLEANSLGQALSPDVSGLPRNGDKGEKNHGAGIWNDNAFYEITADKAAVQQVLPDLLKKAKDEFTELILVAQDSHGNYPRAKWPLNDNQLRDIIGQHFHCKAVLHTRPAEQVDPPILKELNRLLRSADQLDTAPPRYDDWVSTVMFQAATVLALYDWGFDQRDPVFTPLKYGRRLPSLLEIATREFRKGAHKEKYDKLVRIIEDNYGQEDDAAETDSENLAILQLLKKKDNGRSDFRKRHKYVVIVQSDGDNVGGTITGSTDLKYVKNLSTQLMTFSKLAVNKIVKYHGLPVYAGGDDLLFIAPLRNEHDESIFDLLKNLNAAFVSQPMIRDAGGTLSFGISIFYYKTPMGESLEEGRKQLFRIAKKLKYRRRDSSEVSAKNALAFRVLLHGGQAFGATLQQQGEAWDKWLELLHTSQNTDDLAFLSGLVHRLERLGVLLEAACDGGTAEAFFRNHFNEARGQQWDFILKVRELAEAIFRQYGALDFDNDDVARTFFQGQLHIERCETATVLKPENRRRHYCNNLLYSALRLIQFQQAEDHD